jgi:hypothetical protein
MDGGVWFSMESFQPTKDSENISMPPVQLQHDPRKVVEALLARANRLWMFALGCKAGSVLLGSLLIILLPNAKFSYIPVAIVYLASELLSWRSDSFKGTAQTIHRKLDFMNSFGWEISGKEMSDHLMGLPKKMRKAIPKPSEDTYFASTTDPGPTRALENLQESAWWSKQLAGRMGDICLWVTIGLVAISLIVLIWSVNAVQDANILSSIGRLITSVLMLIFSVGIWRLILGYYTFRKKAEVAEQQAEALLNSGCDPIDALKAWHDYQVARASAPLIPSSLWSRMRDDLNQTWKAYRLHHPSRCTEKPGK